MAKIMIVDDAGVIRAILKKYLVAGGHQIVYQATNGLEAVSGYIEHKPDLVTMDMSMPDMGGIPALKKIMAYDPKAKVIMVSAIDQKDLVVEALAAGAIHYIVKPVTEHKVVEIIGEVLKPNKLG